VLLKATNGGTGGRRCCFSSLSLLYSVFSFCFSLLLLFSAFFSCLSLLFILSVPLFPPFFVLFPFPCFYRQKQGRETWLRRPLCCRPSTALQHMKSGLCRRLFEGVGIFLEGLRAVTEEGRKIIFFPCFARPGEEDDDAVQRHRFDILLFFL